MKKNKFNIIYKITLSLLMIFTMSISAQLERLTIYGIENTGSSIQPLQLTVEEAYADLTSRGADSTKLSIESLERLKNYYYGMPGVISTLGLSSTSYGDDFIRNLFSRNIPRVNSISDRYIQGLVQNQSNDVLQDLTTKLNDQKQKLEEYLATDPTNQEANNALNEVNDLISKANINDLLNGNIQDFADRVNTYASDDAINAIIENTEGTEDSSSELADAKSAAKQEVENKANEKIAEINANQEATQEEKKAAIDAVNAAKDAALSAIDDATTNGEIETAKNAGITNINNVALNPTEKSAAKQEVENKANEKIAEINANQEATQEEKQAAIDAVNAAKDAALSAIDGATTTQGVTDAKDAGITNINNVALNPTEKSAAKQEVENKANEKIAEINSNPNATQEEKDAAIANINAKRDQALSAIDAATTNEGVENAKNDGIHNIDDITVDTSAKDNATSAITTKANEQIAKINASTTMTEEEKQAAIEKVKQIEEEYLEKINQAGSGQEVVSLIEEAKTKIESVDTVGVIKQEASEMINQMADEKIAMIQQDPKATEEEKQKAIDAVNEIRMAYLTKLDFAKTNQEVEGLVEQAKVDFEKVQIEYQPKANQTPNTADTSDVSRGLMMVLFSLLASLGIIVFKKRSNQN